MSILRMIKFFGWEHEVQRQIGEKRQEELRYLKRSKMLDLITANLKYALQVFDVHTVSSSLPIQFTRTCLLNVGDLCDVRRCSFSCAGIRSHSLNRPSL